MCHSPYTSEQPRPTAQQEPVRTSATWTRLLLVLIAVTAPQVHAQLAEGGPPPLLQGTGDQIIEGQYLVRLNLPGATQRSGLSSHVASNRLAHRQARAAGASEPPLLSPGASRRVHLESLEFKVHRHAAKDALEAERIRLSDLLGRELAALKRHSTLITAFATELSDEEVALLARDPGVASIEPVVTRALTSDVSSIFVGAVDVWDGTATGVPSKGAGIVVGVLDSGIEREHQSFQDPGIANPLGPGVFRGLCVANPGFCNDKLVGIWDCTGVDCSGTPADPTDDTGHGSHVASIALGNQLDAGPDPVQPLPMISGIAPHASVIAYDVCNGGCSGLLLGLEQALLDGVDVINVSITGNTAPWGASDSLAMLELVEAGVVVVASAGNGGPVASSVLWLDPWVITVGSSSHDRSRYMATLTPADGTEPRPAPMEVITMGAAVGSLGSPVEIVYGDGDANFDEDIEDQCAPATMGTYSGEVVLCDNFGTAPFATASHKANSVMAAGGVALIELGFPLFPLTSVIPSSRVPDPAVEGAALKAWIQAGPDLGVDQEPKVSITAGTLVRVPAFGDVVSHFSARGPALGTIDILKPDLVAPGHWILAADWDQHQFDNPPGDLHLNRRQGTSMSSPQVAGAAALLLALDPTLTPAQVKSILQTTAKHDDLSVCNTFILPFPCDTPTVDPSLFDIGSGRLAVAIAAQAGLALDESGANFTAADPGSGGDPATLNLASMSKADCPGGCAFARTVDGIAPATLTWTGSFTSVGGSPVAPPANLEYHVVPASFDLANGGQQQIAVGIYATSPVVESVWQEALLELTPSDIAVPTARLPIAIKPSDSSPSTDLAVAVTVDTPAFNLGDPVVFTVTLTNLTTVPAVASTVSAALPPGAAAVTWTCSAAGNSVCGTPTGGGALADTNAIFSGDPVTYTYTIGDTSLVTTGSLELTATVATPAGLTDTAAPNNTASASSSEILFADGFESGDTNAWQ